MPMMHISLYERARMWVLAGWRNRAVSFKAVVYALVGVVNTAIDYSVFLAADTLLGLPLVAANTLSWMVAVSNSYMLNSTITFAAESGRKLRWLAYFPFFAAFTGVVGKATGCHGELHCELFNVELRRVPRAPQSTGDQLTTSRRFPPPWSVEDIGVAYVVKDANDQQLAYVYFEEEPGRRSAFSFVEN